MSIIQIPSPNFTRGQVNKKVEGVVIHIMVGTLDGTDSWFQNPQSQVSSHYGVGTDGEVHQYVQEKDNAWHAGVTSNPTWALFKPGVNPNSYTIGIEHEGDQNTVWSEEMKASSAKLIREICNRWEIPIDRQHVIGHYEIRSTKPNCPAVNKGIIDELIALANVTTPQPPDNNVAKAIQKLEEALALLKA